MIVQGDVLLAPIEETLMFVGIPTLNRYDLLEGCLESLSRSNLVPSLVCIVDNGGQWKGSTGWPFPVWMLRPHRNLGVAASWNLLKRVAGPQDVVLMNDDVQVASDSLGRLMNCPSPFVSLCDTPGFEARRQDAGVLVSDWSCFLQRDSVWSEVGPYDERFWPAGHEDSDYWCRMKSRGIEVARLPAGGMRHRVSASLATFSPSEQKRFDEANRQNAAYYLQKWGGPPGQERF